MIQPEANFRAKKTSRNQEHCTAPRGQFARKPVAHGVRSASRKSRSWALSPPPSGEQASARSPRRTVDARAQEATGSALRVAPADGIIEDLNPRGGVGGAGAGRLTPAGSVRFRSDSQRAVTDVKKLVPKFPWKSTGHSS